VVGYGNMAFRDSNPSGALVKGSQEGLPQAQLVGENEPIEVVLEVSSKDGCVNFVIANKPDVL